MAEQGAKERELSLRPPAENPQGDPPTIDSHKAGCEETPERPPPPTMVKMLDAEDIEGCHFIGPR